MTTKINVNVDSGYYECGDGCCSDWYTNISVNNVSIKGEYSDELIALATILTGLGIDPNMSFDSGAEETIKAVSEKMGWEYEYSESDSTLEDMEFYYESRMMDSE